MSRAWFKQSERSNPFTLRLVCWIALHTGRSITRLLLYPITAYFFATSATARRASRAYLLRNPACNSSAWQVLKHIYWFSATVLDRVYFITDQYEKFDIEIQGREIFEKHLDAKKGCILLGSHMGSFELLRCMAINRDNIPLKILMYRDHNQMITKILDTLNPQVAQSVINLANLNALLEMHEAVERGEMVGMLGDRLAESDKEVSVQLLGDRVTFPAGAVLLASILQVPIVLFFGLYRGGNRYSVYIEELTEGITSDRSQRDEEVSRLTQEYASRIEHYMKSDPLNWFNFYDYWHDESH